MTRSISFIVKYGTALFVTVASVFIAQLNNISLNGADYVTIV